jgi:hypothetical protein
MIERRLLYLRLPCCGTGLTRFTVRETAMDGDDGRGKESKSKSEVAVTHLLGTLLRLADVGFPATTSTPISSPSSRMYQPEWSCALNYAWYAGRSS